MSDENRLDDDIFECKMYITDLETNKDSKEINVSDLVFNDYIEFEFGNYEDEDYGTLPYKDFKFFINDYSVTFYSPQYKKIKEKLNKQKEVLDKIKEYRKWLDKNTVIYNSGECVKLNGTYWEAEGIKIILDKILEEIE